MAKKIDLNTIIDLSEALERDTKAGVSMGVHLEKTRPTDFKIIKKLAKGGYGEVYVVEKNGKVYAMKKVSKLQVLKNPNTNFFRNEKEIMTTHGLDWLVRSYYCLQDDTHLYYIMDFIHGGDLMGYLSKKDIMKEEEIRFYGAELVVAIDAMHSTGWIHRDLKPDNILLDRDGHVKLADFGSCIRLVNGHVTSNITVGTPDYISPDVLSSTGETVVYGPEVDYWAVGVILYEMYFGFTPFYSNTLKETYSKISEIAYTFEENISNELKDLISHLLCRKEKRFGYKQIVSHPFFKGVDWENIRQMDPPFKPKLMNEHDISNFVDTEFNEDIHHTNGGYLPFIGFTYDPDCVNVILETLKQEYTIKETHESIKYNIENLKVNTEPGSVIFNNKEISLEVLRGQEKKLNELHEMINSKNREHDILKRNVQELLKSKNELFSQVSSLNTNLQQSIEQIAHKKEYLDQLQTDLSNAKEQLNQVKVDISEKRRIACEITKKNSTFSCEVEEELRDLKKSIDRFKLKEKLDKIQQAAYWFYKQNTSLSKELKALSITESENKSLEDLKKQLRLQKSEIREYEQKIETEMLLRKKAEEEIKSLKKLLKEASNSINKFSITGTNANSNKDVFISIENGMFRLNSEEYVMNSVYMRDLKNNEMHHLSYKKRGLCVLLFLLVEPLKTSSTTSSRRSIRALEADLEKEQLIFKSIDQLIEVLDGKTKEDAMNQRRGAMKKIEQLKNEIENSKKSTIQECTIQDDEQVYEFNSHVFYEKTVAKGSLCEYCNEVLYGLVNQAYCCTDCLLVVHKSCYCLVDVSCELNKAIKAGRSIPVICKTLEEKEKLLKLNKMC